MSQSINCVRHPTSAWLLLILLIRAGSGARRGLKARAWIKLTGFFADLFRVDKVRIYKTRAKLKELVEPYRLKKKNLKAQWRPRLVNNFLLYTFWSNCFQYNASRCKKWSELESFFGWDSFHYLDFPKRFSLKAFNHDVVDIEVTFALNVFSS